MQQAARKNSPIVSAVIRAVRWLSKPQPQKK